MSKLTRSKTCGSKVRHATRDAAESHIERLEHGKLAWPGMMRAYPCIYCKRWHVGRKSGAQRKIEFKRVKAELRRSEKQKSRDATPPPNASKEQTGKQQ